MKHLSYVILFAVIGFFIGYFIFGDIFGRRIPLEYLFLDTNSIVGFISDLLLRQIKQKILISSVIGGAFGFLISFVRDLVPLAVGKAV